MLEVLEKQNTAEPSYSQAVGLTRTEAERLLNISGENSIGDKKKNSAVRIFANQFHDVMVMILLAATVISVILGEYADAFPIMIIEQPISLIPTHTTDIWLHRQIEEMYSL